MSRTAVCQACNNERWGVKTRLSVDHTCGTNWEQRKKLRELQDKQDEDIAEKLGTTKQMIFAIREAKELARQDIEPTPRTPESYWKQRFV